MIAGIIVITLLALFDVLIFIGCVKLEDKERRWEKRREKDNDER